MKKYIALALFFVLSNLAIAADIEKQKHILSVGMQTYAISSAESLMLLGAEDKKFLSDEWYWGEAGFGAVSGQRAGFLEGGVVAGFRPSWHLSWSLDFQLLLGAGGGGGASQGGGLVVHPSLSFGLLEVGYVRFLNGDIGSVSWGAHIDADAWSLSQGKPNLGESDLRRLEKRRVVQHILYEQYLNADQGLTSVFGYHFDAFFSDEIYLATAIFGAVGGHRGGYGIAAFGLGYRMPMAEKWSLDSKFLLGSGGGGGLAAGGGFAVAAQAGPSWEFLPHVFLDAKAGYLAFPSGSFSTPTIQAGVSFDSFRLELPN